MGLLVGDEGPVRLLACVDARLEACLPEHLVAAEEREMDARVAGRLHVPPLAPRPVLVVPHGQKEPVVRDELAPPVAVDPGGVAHVVAARLQEPHEGVLRVEDGVHGPVVAGFERTVVAHLVGAGRPPVLARVLGVEASVGAVPTVSVVGLPGGVGGLEQDVGAARVVANDEVDVARARLAQRDAEPPVAEGAVGVRDRLGADGGRVGEWSARQGAGSASASWRTRRAK